jgi:hypothetical protein
VDDDDGLAAARALLPGWQLEVAERLRSGERSTVNRVAAIRPDGSPAEVVVKLYTTAGEGWVRECAALECLERTGAAPRLIAAGGEPPVAVVEYVGQGTGVADALLGTDRDAATTAVIRWAEAVAALHVASRDSRPEFRAALERREGDLPVADAYMVVGIEDAIRQLDAECAALGVAIPTGSFDALRGLEHRLSGTGAAALSPSDTCPDNNVVLDDRVVLLDFEDAQWRNLAWDVAYLSVPWPTCWCSWALPDDVAEAALAAYRAVAAPAFPDVAADGFLCDVAAAAVAWSLMSTMWFLPSIRAGDPPLDPERPGPLRRAVVGHRLAVSAGIADTAGLAPLGELAQLLGERLAERHGLGALELAPAFRAAGS